MPSESRSYQELEARLAEAEAQLDALRSGEVDVIVGKNDALVVKLRDRDEELQRYHGFVRAILDNLSAHICVLDETGNILDVNMAWKSFAIPNELEDPQFAVGSNYIETCEAATGDCAEGAAEAAHGIRAVLEGREPKFYLEYPCHSPDEKRWFEMRVTPLPTPQGTSCVVAHENITARKQAEETLLNEEMALRTTLHSLGDGVIAVDTAGRVTRMNRAAEELTGYPRTQAQGKNLDDVFQLVDTKSREPRPLDFKPLLEDGHAIDIPDDMMLLCRDGRLRAVADSIAPVHNSVGRITGAVVVFRDESDQRRNRNMLEARVALIDYATTHGLDELLAFALDTIGDLVDSPIGVYHFVDEDAGTLTLQQWSTRAREELCTIEPEQWRYDLDDTGVWADCVRTRQPVIHNDFERVPNKRGMPEGHARVSRELVVPVVREGRVVAVLGVGNKPTDYGPGDLETVSYLADVTWEVVDRKRAETAVRESEARFRGLFQRMMTAVSISVPVDGGNDFEIVDFNAAAEDITHRKREAVVGRRLTEVYPNIEQSGFLAEFKRVNATGEPVYVPPRTYADDRLILRADASIFRLESGEIVCMFHDFTREHQRELDLLIRHQALHNVSTGIAIVDANRYFQYCNPALARITGYAVDELLGHALGVLAGEATAERIFTEAARPGGFIGEIEANRKSGEAYPAMVHLAAVRDTNGEIVSYVGALSDLTNIKLAESELRHSNQALRMLSSCNEALIRATSAQELLESIPRLIVQKGGYAAAWVARCNDDGQLMRESGAAACEACRAIVEAPVDETAVSRRAAAAPPGHVRAEDAVLSGDDVPCPPTEVDRQIGVPLNVAGRRFGVLCVLTEKDRPCTLEEIALLEELGGDLSYGLTSLQERALRAEAEATTHLLRTALENSVDAALITDASGTIEWINNAFTQQSGYAAEDAVGHTPGIVNSGQHPESFYAELWDTIGRGAFWRGEITNRNAHGHLYVVDTSITPLVDDEGRVTHYIALQQDVTEKKELEAQYRQAQKQEAIGTLAGGIAHDFNNVLAAILGYSELMQDEFAEGSRLRHDLDRIREAAQRARGLVAQILTFSRMRELDRVPLRLEHIVKEALKLIRATIPASIELRENVYSSRMAVNADATQMHQLILNLCTNAYQAIGEAQGEIAVLLEPRTVDTEEARQRVGLEPGEYEYLEVTDTGSGMRPETLERIFEPFFTTKETGEGTGLGLATVHGIVEQHGGHIAVESEVGKGTTFGVWLPCVEEVPEEETLGSSELEPGAGRILVVDDEPNIVDVVSRRLGRLGYEVLEFTRPDDALAFIRDTDEPIDLVISDQQMPKIHGREFARAVHEARPELPIVAMTGHSQTVNEDNYERHGFVGYLQKPIEGRQLAGVVQSVLRG